MDHRRSSSDNLVQSDHHIWQLIPLIPARWRQLPPIILFVRSRYSFLPRLSVPRYFLQYALSAHPSSVGSTNDSRSLSEAKVYQSCLATAIVTSGRLARHARRSPKSSEGVLVSSRSGSNGDRLPANATRASAPRTSVACAGATLKMSH